MDTHDTSLAGPDRPPAPDFSANPLLRRPDPGSRKAGTITLVLLIPVLLVVVGLQQFSVIAGGAQIVERARTEVVPPAAGDGFTLVSKMMVKFEVLLSDLASAGAERSTNAGQFVTQVDQMAQSPSEKVRAAIVAAELVGVNGLDDRIDRAAETVLTATASEQGLGGEASTKLLDDLQTIETIYLSEEGRAGVEPTAIDGLVARHGWFGELAAAHGDDAARAELTKGGGLLLTLLAVMGGVMLLAFTGGLVMLILAVVFAGTGRLRAKFVAPLPGGSVYLETFAVFVGGFMVVQLLGALLTLVMSEGEATVTAMGLQWLLVLVVGWPLVRGVPRGRWRADLGLIAPRGVWREIGAGVAGYMAGVPMYVAAAMVSLVLVVAREAIVGAAQSAQGGDPAPVVGPSGPVNPVFEMVSSMGLVGVIVLGSLVVLWAPLVEELIMRGALYRHLRSRLHWLVSAIVSAMLFGVLHQYDVLMLLPVISLGLVFAAVREWRGSVIGCITGHMLHNATIFGLVVAMLIGLG